LQLNLNFEILTKMFVMGKSMETVYVVQTGQIVVGFLPSQDRIMYVKSASYLLRSNKSNN